MGFTSSISLEDGDPVASGTQIYPGQELTLTFTASPTGEETSISGVQLTTGNLRLYDANGTQIATVAMNLTWTRTGGDTDSDNVMDQGETWTWTASYTIPADLLATYPNAVSVKAQATISGSDQDSDPEQSSTTSAGFVTIVDEPEPAISLVKTADKETFEGAGELITYTFEVTNTGNRALSDLTVTDDMTSDEAAVTVRIGDLDQDGEQDEGETWTDGFVTLGDLDQDGVFDIGETWTWRGTYTTQAGDTADIVNTAEASAYYGQTEVTGTDTVTVEYEPPPPVTDHFRDIGQISNIVLYFDTPDGDGRKQGRDGVYTVKIDGVATAAADDLDVWFQDVLDFLDATNAIVGRDNAPTLLGVAVKAGQKTEFFALDNDPTDAGDTAVLTATGGRLVTDRNLDVSYTYGAVYDYLIPG